MSTPSTRVRDLTEVRPRKTVLEPPALKVSDTAEYVTSGGHEIRYSQDDNNLWYCFFYKGGQLPESLSGRYATKKLLHQAIVNYLDSDNVRGTAKWPK